MDNRNINIRKLTLWQVVIVGIAYMTPMTVFDTFGIVSEVTEGRVPLAYIFALFAMLLTAFSYARFSRQSERPGSAYTYTAESCGPQTGFFVGWCSLLDYILLPLINALLAGIYLHALIPAIPYVAWVFVAAGLVTLVNCFRIHILANLSMIFVFAPLLLLLVFIYLVIRGVDHDGAAHVLTLTPLFNGDTSIMPLITGASILCFSFLGFDAVTTLSHETHDPKKTIPRAVILTTLFGGVIFISASWFIQLYFPDNSRFKDPEAALPEIALYVGGALFQAVFLVGQIMNTVASGLASHASAARLIHIMGRDGIFHKGIFGSTNHKLGTPLYSVITIGLISMMAMFLDLSTVVSLISFGALIAFTAVNFSVFMHFYVHKKQRQGLKNFVLNLVLPLLSVLAIVALWINLEASALHFGCIWLAIGVAMFIYKKLRKQSIVISNA
ncbi:APC family permease [Acinetobacter qingfengensis]|uniref:Putrescine/spermidine ABC transporter n=1 Tax=Acinetobacter qingfengensis TaxID=1262585 RepID=A0A1E7R743_9GAMM|nr:APC family permease [Acinetobacter qingfengensis]KAA8734415.1 APC family permease [Acinetobacter qingfengensis]OEY95138.1 putrescine/spermidine ABC transporter [Acinetobacter qingfengensis]